MRVTAFIGSARKKNTYKASEQFLQKLRSLGDIEYEIVMLSDYNLEICKGCLLCFNKGEEFCPFKDDRDRLIEKMISSDGVIFASPTYSFQVSGLMKIFLDRLAFFGNTCSRRTFDNQATELLLACFALNRMTHLGMPDSYAFLDS